VKSKVQTQERFEGFSKAGLQFLRDLAKHNDRSWFQPRKPTYETELLEPLQALVADATAAMRKAKIALAADPTRPSFRIYRDIRFSRDKSPYKTNLGAYLPPGGRRGEQGGIYVHIQPKQSFMAVGYYELDKDRLMRWRTAMAKTPKGFQAMLAALKRNGVSLSEHHEDLKRMPRGFEAYADSPTAPYFRRTSFMVSERLSDADVGSKRVIARMVALARKAKPFLAYGEQIG